MRSELIYQQRLERVTDYIARNLQADLSLKTLAALCNFSSFHFHRIFQCYAGETLREHIIRTRLERALFLLQHAPKKSLQAIAFECGFGSASDFSRRFFETLGVRPSTLKTDNALHAFLQSRTDVLRSKTQPGPIHDELANSRVNLQTWPAWQYVYKRVTGGYLKPARLIDGYHALEQWIDAQGIARGDTRLIGMSMDDPSITAHARCRYDFCRTTEHIPKRDSGLSSATMPACQWAVLPCKGGMQRVSATWDFLFRVWLPNSGFEPAALPALEVFLQRPEEIGWDQFNLLCCVPVQALRR